MNIPFHRPIIPKQIEKLYPMSVKDGWITTGPQVKAFESSLSDVLESKYVVAVNSCTAALHLALLANQYKKGDKFIAPTYTFVSTVEVGEYLGMKPILVDCDANYNMDLNQVEDLLKKENDIKAIIPVHFAGKTIDMLEIKKLSEQFGLFILEDAAHALESKSNYGKVGNTDDAAAFSFYANKNITTAGEGGAIATNNKKYADKVRQLSLHGMSKDGWKRFEAGGKWKYDIAALGYKYNMTDISASFGQWQIQHLKEWHKKRLLIFKAYNDIFSKIEGLYCPRILNDNEEHAYHLYIIRLDVSMWKIDRNKMIKILNDYGIGTSVHYTPVHMHSYYQKKYGFKPYSFPKAKEYSDNVISLPMYPALTNSEINYITKTIVKIWEKYKSI